jgi:hypothetical protein
MAGGFGSTVLWNSVSVAVPIGVDDTDMGIGSVDFSGQSDLTNTFYSGTIQLVFTLETAPSSDIEVSVAIPKALDFTDTEQSEGLPATQDQLLDLCPSTFKGTVPGVLLNTFTVLSTDAAGTTYSVDIESPVGELAYQGTLNRRLADDDWPVSNQRVRFYFWDDSSTASGLAFENIGASIGPNLVVETVQTFPDRFTGLGGTRGPGRADSSPVSGKKSLRSTWIPDGYRGILVDPDDWDPPEEIPRELFPDGDNTEDF